MEVFCRTEPEEPGLVNDFLLEGIMDIRNSRCDKWMTYPYELYTSKNSSFRKKPYQSSFFSQRSYNGFSPLLSFSSPLGRPDATLRVWGLPDFIWPRLHTSKGKLEPEVLTCDRVLTHCIYPYILFNSLWTKYSILFLGGLPAPLKVIFDAYVDSLEIALNLCTSTLVLLLLQRGNKSSSWTVFQ